MAEVAGEGAAAFWSRDASDEEQPAVYIPGLCGENNLRLASKFKSVKAEERKVRGPGPTPVTAMDFLPDWPKHAQGPQGEAGARSASLKDLCPEDKRRIANLIKELARVSEEKEVTEERLKSEHESFEKKIRHLEQQNNLIATEREALQQQYRECQELLSLYQKYLSEQQDKLNRSLSDLGARSAKPQQVPKFQLQPTEGELNGSYLGQGHQPSSDLESVSSIAVHPFCRTDHPARCGFHWQPDRCPSENCLQRKCCSLELAEPHYPEVTQGHHRGSASALERPLSRCCLHRAPHSTPAKGPAELLITRPPGNHSLSRHSAGIAGRGNGLTTHVKDSAASERRKHELMLQKMELEVEKERLQQLLEQQEARLLEKQQELLQTRLEPESSLAEIQTREAAVGTTPSLGAILGNGSAVSPAARGCSVLPTPPSSKDGKKARGPGGARSGRKTAEIQTDLQEDELLQSPECKGSWKDAATAPSVAGLRTEIGQQSPNHKDVYRYETSLIDMLEAISPISFQKQNRHHTKLHDLHILSPPPRSLSKPHRPAAIPGTQKPPTVDPEESRILEDIFFIC